jgi:pimeloyl-ACP methyl ester carboxylesterase
MSASPAIQITQPAQGRTNGDGVSVTFNYWPGRGTPIVCIHGLTASSMSFVGLAESFAGRRAVLSIDLRGRGNSDKPLAPYGMAQHAHDVAAVLRAFGAESYIVVGHSMGAYIATALAAQEPELVAGLVMLDGGYFLPMPEGLSADEVLNLVVGPSVIGRLNQTFASREAYLEYWCGLPAYPQAEWNAWLETYLAYDLGGDAPNLQPKGSEAAVRADFADMLQRAEVTARLQAVKCPTMVLRAQQGMAPGQPGILPDVVMQAIAALIPHANIQTIKDVTHYTILFNPRGVAEVATLISAFSERCRNSLESVRK